MTSRELRFAVEPPPECTLVPDKNQCKLKSQRCLWRKMGRNGRRASCAAKIGQASQPVTLEFLKSLQSVKSLPKMWIEHIEREEYTDRNGTRVPYTRRWREDIDYSTLFGKGKGTENAPEKKSFEDLEDERVAEIFIELNDILHESKKDECDCRSCKCYTEEQIKFFKTMFDRLGIDTSSFENDDVCTLASYLYHYSTQSKIYDEMCGKLSGQERKDCDDQFASPKTSTITTNRCHRDLGSIISRDLHSSTLQPFNVFALVSRDLMSRTMDAKKELEAKFYKFVDATIDSYLRTNPDKKYFMDLQLFSTVYKKLNKLISENIERSDVQEKLIPVIHKMIDNNIATNKFLQTYGSYVKQYIV